MKKDGRKRDIKSKLVAAVCMLLVSCIMMVSSTYAWFTLSTAPEVTGITTAVGANGNLEMALLPTTSDAIKTIQDALNAIGTSTSADDTVVFKNTTWGNLVNLSDAGYGLSNIALYPSRLNPEGITGGALLEAPTYGADGRVNGFEDVLLNGIYDGTANFYEGGYGVRAVGSSTGMSARELAYRTALAAGDAATSAASTAASQSMNVGGSQLATIAIKRAMDNTATYEVADVQALLDVFEALAADNGPLAKIEEAFRQYAIAEYLSDFDGTDYSTTVSAIQGSELSALATYLPAENISTVLTSLATMQSTVDNAVTKLTALVNENKESYAWTDFNTYVNILGTADNMTLNNEVMSHWTDKDDAGNFKNIAALVQAATSPAGLTIVVTDGIYYDMAQYTGNLVGNVKMEDIEYNGLVATVNATMKANSATTPAYLPAAKAAVGTFVKSNNDTDAPISTFYGYIIDLGFRTNAADSYLQLQTNGIDRIYENGTNSNTQGGGSTMSFNVVEGFNQTKVANLMSSIRVVFFNPETFEVYQQARLDADTLVATDTKYTMDLKLWDTTTGDFKDDSDSTPNVDESTAITALIQNEAKAVSVLVYLDGENLTNGDVATSDLAGTMNLQFSSSATLNPMEYGELMSDGTTAAADDEEPTT